MNNSPEFRYFVRMIRFEIDSMELRVDSVSANYVARFVELGD